MDIKNLTELMLQHQKNDGNIVFSPIGVWAVFTMLKNSAKNEDKASMKQLAELVNTSYSLPSLTVEERN